MSSQRSPRTPRRLLLLRVLVPIGSIVIVLVLLELVLRQLPVKSQSYYMPGTEADPIHRLRPNSEFVWSRDWDLSSANRVSINNAGFVSNIDYVQSATKPLLVVIGDSYVESMMVPYEQTCAGLLASQLNLDYRVYSFGTSGSPLSQYLALAKYAKDTFGPDLMWFLIVGNDYDESLFRYKQVPGLHYFMEQENNRLVHDLLPYEPISGILATMKATVKDWAVASALFRYVYYNLELVHLARRIIYGDRGNYEVTDNFETRIWWSKRAVDAFLDTLDDLAGLEVDKIGFIVDGGRHLLYEHNYDPIDSRYDKIMQDYFISNSIKIGYDVIDMEPIFTVHYASHNERFDWYRDFHWNSLGHRLCFEELSRSVPFAEGGN